MKRLVTLLLLAAFTASCTEKRPIGVVVLPVERLTPTYHDQYTGLASPARLVIEDPQAFEEVWNRAFGGYGPSPPLPAVDFAHEVVVVAALGEQSSGGYSIRVAGAVVTSSAVLISVESTAPGARCVVSGALTQPLDIVKIARSGRGFRFQESSLARSCR